jgi:phage terminase small subunit
MKKKNFMVKRIARKVRVENQDLRSEFGLNPSAEREMTT